MDIGWIFDKYRWVYVSLILTLGYICYTLYLVNIWYPVILTAALMPGIFYLMAVRYSDVGAREPRGVIALQILIGILLIFPAIYLERIGVQTLIGLGLSPRMNYRLNSVLFWSLYAIIIVAPVEEGLKLLGSIFGNKFHHENDEATDSIVYTVGISAGFALYENYRYIFTTIESLTFTDALTLAIARSFTAIPLHLGCAMVMGYYLSGFYHPNKFGLDPSKKKTLLLRAFVVPVVIHGLYDLLVFLIFFSFVVQVASALIFITIFTVIIWKRVIELRSQGQYPFISL